MVDIKRLLVLAKDKVWTWRKKKRWGMRRSEIYGGGREEKQ